MMPKFKQAVFAALTSAPLACVSADSDPSASLQATPDIMNFAPAVSEPVLAEQPIIENKAVPVAPTLKEMALSPFTGKIRGKKVRMRLDADTESRIIRELDKNELVTVVGEKGNFYAVQPHSSAKAYVFRSFVLDDVVEGNRVNIRLEPDMEAPVIGHFNSGDRLQRSTVCSQNSKWLEIAVPSHVHFYVSKDYVENIGGPDVKEQLDKRRSSVKLALDNATNLVKAELRKTFDEIDIEKINRQFDKIAADCNEFADLSERVAAAQEDLQNSYAQLKSAFLETKASREIEDAAIQEETITATGVATPSEQKVTDKMLLWQPVEEALYLNWAALNQDRNMQEYYNDQQAVATSITGILEAYTAPVKNKPGDFILKEKDLPVAYIYSTKINLQDSVGKRVKLKAVARPNNNFAFPAYFVLSQE